MKESIDLENEIAWDRTNIGENYPGVTLPLTYSFIKDAYSHVYENFLLRIGVSKERIDNNRISLDNMLGYVKGHVFYNIENWYVFLKFLPGYKYNKKFFEAMLDPVIQKKGEKEIIHLSFWENIKITFKFLTSLIFFDKLHNQFERKFSQLLQEFKRNKLSLLNNFELVSLFQSTEKKFFSIWSITIINDFKVMIFFGLLKKFAEKHEEESKEILRNIYSLKNQPRSILPLKEITNLATTIRENDKYVGLFKKDTKQILSSLDDSSYSQLDMLIKNYLEEYGERSSNELKLEEPKFKDNPESFINLIKYYVGLNEKEISNMLFHLHSKRTFSIPDKYSLKDKIILNFFKSITTQGIYQREYYRLKRGKTFNMAREILIEIGKRMKQAGDLQELDDIFYLYKHEVFDYIRFHSLQGNFKRIIQFRKRLIEKYKKEQLLRRLTTYGLPSMEKCKTKAILHNHFLQGQATSRGITRGEVIVMEKLNLTADYKGKILVTTATDPGWTVIFPLLRGVITEQGGVLSHASIIARELGIPCIVKVNDATRILKNDQIIDMDATSGKVTIIN